jgi:hypothetical protein
VKPRNLNCEPLGVVLESSVALFAGRDGASLKNRSGNEAEKCQRGEIRRDGVWIDARAIEKYKSGCNNEHAYG